MLGIQKTFAAVLLLAILAFGNLAKATTDTLNLPVSQTWSNAALFQTNNKWTNVPGWMGYLGDDSSSTAAPYGGGAQLVLTPNSNSNVTTNSLFSASGGGVHYVAASQVVAIQGSGTADYPHIVVHLKLTTWQNINVSYNLKQLDNDPATQPISLQYRIGNTGNFTDIPAAYIADASTSASTSGNTVIPVSVTLPAAVNGQSEVQLRWLTVNVPGSDCLIGIDDISITGTVLADNPNLAASNSIVFGPVSSASTQDKGLVITNTGSSNQLIVANTSNISGTDAGKFSIIAGQLPLAVNAGTSQVLNVRFTPGGAAGSFAATLNLNSNDSSDPAVAIALTGTSTDDPNLSAVSSLNFGTVVSNTSKTTKLIVTNTGTANALNITAATFSGTNGSKFGVVSGIPATIAVGASSTVTLKVTPGGVLGNLTGTLALASNDQTSATVNIGLAAYSSAAIISGYDYLHPTPSVVATNAQLLTYAGIASGTFIPLCIALDNDGGLLVLLEESNTVGSTSQTGNGGSLIKISADGATHSVIVPETAIIAALSDNTAANDINPNGLQVGADGTIYLSEFAGSGTSGTNNEVVKITRPGNVVTKLATVPGIGSMKYDPANNRLLFCQVSAFGASDNLITAVSVSDGTLTPVITSAELATMTGLTGAPELQPFIIDPTNSANLIGFIETSFGGNDSMIRINGYNNSATRTVSVIAASTAWPTLPGYTPMVGAEGALFGMETNAAGGAPGQWRFTVISPSGSIYTTNSDDLDILFGFAGANTNDDTLRDVYPKNIAELAAKKVGSNIEVFLASATGQRGIFKLTYAPIVAVNKAKNWNIME